MYQTDFDDFQKTLTDLCTSVNRPCNDNLVRVFWEDLKDVPFGAVKARAKILRVTGKKNFASNDLRPTAEEVAPRPSPTGRPITDQLSEFVLSNYELTPNQIRSPWTWLCRYFDAVGIDGKMHHNHGAEITGVVIPADGDTPSIRVNVVDMQSNAA